MTAGTSVNVPQHAGGSLARRCPAPRASRPAHGREPRGTTDSQTCCPARPASTACTLAPAWRRMLRWFPPTLRRCPVPRQVRRLDRRRGRPPGSCPGPGPRQPGRVVPTEPRCGNWTAPAYGQYGASRNRAAAGTSPRFRSRHRRISGWRPARRCGQARPGDKCGGRTDWWCADGPPAGTGPRRVLRKAPDGLAGSRPRDPGCRRWRPGRHR